MNNRFYFQFVLIFLVTALGACAFAQSVPKNTRQNKIHSFRYDGLDRHFLVHLPPQYKKGQKLPVVLVFHGGGGNIENVMKQTQMNDTADKYVFIAVYPAGTGADTPFIGKKLLTWNVEYCCSAAQEKNIDDVGFVSKLIDFMIEDYQIDANKVYATGHSNGSMLSFRLACELPDRITAIAPNASQGRMLNCAKGNRAVPIMYMHGEKDSVPIAGGMCGGMFQDFLKSIGIPANSEKAVWECDSVRNVLDGFAKNNTCSLETEITSTDTAVIERYIDCPKNGEINFITLKGSGHTWPGGQSGMNACHDKPNGRVCKEWINHAGQISRFNANENMWDFFSQYSIGQ